jgi:ubiquinone/menaquinone biosynthesis C-methylase UbiE
MPKHEPCPVQHSNILTSFIRPIFQNPRRVLKAFVKPGMIVLDYGCGPGFFTIPLADMVGPEGKVIASDIQRGMLDRLRERIPGRLLSRIIFNTEADIRQKVDFILAFYVMHEVDDPNKTLRMFGDIMKRSSVLYISEPKLHVSREEFEGTLKKATACGFRTLSRSDTLLSRTAILSVV